MGRAARVLNYHLHNTTTKSMLWLENTEMKFLNRHAWFAEAEGQTKRQKNSFNYANYDEKKIPAHFI